MQTTKMVPIASIEADPNQPRKFFDEEGMRMLAESMESQGLLQPISLRPVNGHYQIIAGERRFRAATKLDWKAIPAIVHEEITDDEAAKLQLLENIVRRDMRPLEEYRAYKRLLEGGMTAAEIGKAVGHSASDITWWVNVLRCIPEILDLFDKGHIRKSEAHQLSRLTESGQRKALIEYGKRKMTNKEALTMIGKIAQEEYQGDMFPDTLETLHQRKIRQRRKTAMQKLFEGVGDLYKLLMEEDDSDLRESIIGDGPLLLDQIEETRKAMDMLENLLTEAIDDCEEE